MSNPEPKRKSFLDKLIYISISLSVVIILGGLILIMFSEKLPLEGIFGSGEIAEVDFEALTVTPGPNHYLACPEDYCPMATPDQITEVYPITVDVLSQRFFNFVDGLPRVDLKPGGMDIPNRQFEYLAYNGSNPFPDVVTVRFFDLGGNRSSVAIYSRTLKGEDLSDTNQKLVSRWLRAMEEE